MDTKSLKKLEAQLWESADMLRAGSKLTSNEYCMPVLGLIFLRYAYSRFKLVEAEILKDRPVRNGRVLPVTASDFSAKSALFLPEMARYSFLMGLPADIPSAGLHSVSGQPLNSLGEVVNNAMELIEGQSAQLSGVLPREYGKFSSELLSELLRIFNNDALDAVGGDVIGRIYEYFLNKFAKNIAADDGVFFTPKSLVKMIVNVLEPERGILLDPACGSGGMFVQTGDFVHAAGMAANSAMTFYGQEKVEYNARLCLMNMAVHGLTASIASGDAANSFYQDAHNLVGRCDYVMANPPFNVDKVKAESTSSAGRLPFGLPAVNKNKDVSNANYLWISYFYAYLNERGRAGFVMASSATDSQNKDKDIRRQLVETGHVDVMISVGNNFFYTKSLPCTLWFFDKGKPDHLRDTVLFIDARNYYTVVDRTLNEWNEWQLQNLAAIVWLYRGETQRYRDLLAAYRQELSACIWTTGKRQLSDKGASLPLPVSDAPGPEDATFSLPPDASFQNCLEALQTFLEEQREQSRRAEATAKRTEKRQVAALWEERLAEVQSALLVAQEAQWLYARFGDGVYADIPALCRVAGRKEIEEKNFSLTAGAYVGVPPAEDDGVDFAQRMDEIHTELLRLQAESNALMETISRNWQEMGL